MSRVRESEEINKELEKEIIKILEECAFPVNKKFIKTEINRMTSRVDNLLNRMLEQGKIKNVGKGTKNSEYQYILPGRKYIDFLNNNGNIKAFKKIENEEELISFLTNNKKRLGESKYVYQYTNMAALISMLYNRKFYIGSPKKMNDGLELENSLKNANNIFFASFFIDMDESIAMWSMYAQPWEEGVLIGIPKKNFNKWIRNVSDFYNVKAENKEFGEKNIKKSNARVYIARVAYIKEEKNGYCIRCGHAYNRKFKDIKFNQLSGYIKDDAWSYENETRLRVDYVCDKKCEAIGIDIPNDVIDNIKVVTGPRFEGNLYSKLKACKPKEEVPIKKEQIMTSIFKGKLLSISCDKCKGNTFKTLIKRKCPKFKISIDESCD